MSIYDDFGKTDYLDDVAFIAGTDFTFYFPIYDENHSAISMNGATLKWALCPYGQPDHNILQKSGTLTNGSIINNTFAVKLMAADTADLGDVYTQQIQVINASGSTYRPAQGIVVIRKAITLT